MPHRCRHPHVSPISNVRYLPECGHPIQMLKYPLHLSGFFSPFQNLNSLDDTKS